MLKLTQFGEADFAQRKYEPKAYLRWRRDAKVNQILEFSQRPTVTTKLETFNGKKLITFSEKATPDQKLLARIAEIQNLLEAERDINTSLIVECFDTAQRAHEIMGTEPIYINLNNPDREYNDPPPPLTIYEDSNHFIQTFMLDNKYYAVDYTAGLKIDNWELGLNEFDCLVFTSVTREDLLDLVADFYRQEAKIWR